jgi:hypothetical protein
MAKEDDEITINVDDLDTVVVPLEEDDKALNLHQEPEHIKKEAKRERTKRVLPEIQPEPVVQAGPSPEEVLEQTKAYAKQQEDARKAAEATAANERAMREQAQRQAQEAQQTAEQYREQVDNSTLAIIENGIASATATIEACENEYTRAAEAGELAKLAKIQTKLSLAAAELNRLNADKASFGSRPATTTEGRVVAQEPIAQPSVFDRYLSQFSPQAQNWLRQHPDCAPPTVGGNNDKHSAMMQGHYAALRAGKIEGSAEYFKMIEDTIDPPMVQPVVNTNQSKAAVIQAAEAPRQKHAQPAAPPSREPPTNGGQQPRRGGEVRLTKEQQEVARMSAPPHFTDQQAFGLYARNLIELESEGKLGRTTH